MPKKQKRKKTDKMCQKKTKPQKNSKNAQDVPKKNKNTEKRRKTNCWLLHLYKLQLHQSLVVLSASDGRPFDMEHEVVSERSVRVSWKVPDLFIAHLPSTSPTGETVRMTESNNSRYNVYLNNVLVDTVLARSKGYFLPITVVCEILQEPTSDI